MNTAFISVALIAACGMCYAGEPAAPAADDGFLVERMPFGSGTPASAGTDGSESAQPVADGLFHVPNYLPGFPTAATIWPREVPVTCGRESNVTKCSGYGVIPAIGRGEYIFVRPTVQPVIAEVPREAPREEPQEPIPVTRKKPRG